MNMILKVYWIDLFFDDDVLSQFELTEQVSTLSHLTT